MAIVLTVLFTVILKNGTHTFRPLQFVPYYSSFFNSSEIPLVRFHFVHLQFVLFKVCPITYGPVTISPNLCRPFTSCLKS